MRYLFLDSPYHSQRQFEKPVFIYPAHLAMYSTLLRQQGHEVVWLGKDDGSFDKVIKSDLDIDVPFGKLPIPDRVFTNAMNPKYLSYGNYKIFPGSHYLSSNLCWWAGKKGCTFCVDSKRILDGEPRDVRTVDHVLTEIEDCIGLGFRELFDDAGTIPINDWLHEFCEKMIKSGFNKRVRIGCNLKPIKQDFKLMREAGFRFILVGVESANQETINRIQKGQRCDKVVENLKAMSDAGLEPHITMMSSYPWEGEAEEQKSIELFHHLLKKGYAKTGQVSIYSPPRTKPDDNSIGHKRVPLYFNVYMIPEFWFNKLKDIKCLDDVKYILRGGRLVFEENWRKLCHALRLR